MSNDVDPHRPGDQPQPVNEVISHGSPTQHQGTTGVEPSEATAPTGSFDEVDSSSQQAEPPRDGFVTASGPPLPPVIEAFPGYHDVPKASTPAWVTGSPPAAARRKKRSQPWILLAATMAMAVLIVVGVIGYRMIQNNTAAKPPAAAEPPPAAVLEGTYRVDIDWAKQTENGAPASSSDKTNSSSWWAFRSFCSSTGCVASGTVLDDTNHQVAATPPRTAEFHFVNGQWQRTPVTSQYPRKRCLGADGKIGPGTETQIISWSAEPQPDRSLRGLWTNTVLTDECGFIGTVWQAPLVAVRTGDLPPAVTVADPATITVTPLTSSPVPPVAGATPVLDGTFSVEYDWSKQTVNGKQTIGDMAPSVDWWAFRSLCTSAGCVATGAQLAQENHQAPVGGGMVLRFVDGRWEQTPHLGPGQGCPGGTNPQVATSETFVWSLEPQPDDTLRGIQTDTAMSDECGNRGYVYRTPLLATRKGDVPAAVVLADPSLFQLPPAPPSTSPHP